MSLLYGVTPAGFVSKPMDVITTEVDDGLKAILGDSAGTAPDGTIPLNTFSGQLKTLLVDRDAAQWDGQQTVYSSYDPNSATDQSQDALGAQTGTIRDAAEFSQVTATLTGTPGTIVPATPLPSVALVQDSGTRFDVQTNATIGALSAWVALTGYAVGDRVTNSSKCYQCITLGTSAASGGPTTNAADITDGSVHWTFLGTGTGAVDALFVAEISGELTATARSLNSIATPVSGWTGIINLVDATVGRALESNTDFRIRRESELSAGRQATINAIRGALLAVGDQSTDPTAHVTNVTVFYNDDDVTDGNGVPPHSVNALVLGGHDIDIGNALWSVVGGGIKSFGSIPVTITDTQGNPQVVSFDRPTEIPIWIIVDVEFDPTLFPSPDDLSVGANLIAEALVLYGLTYPTGLSVRTSALSAQVFDGPSSVGGSPVPGVLDVTDLFIGLAPFPGSSVTIGISLREQATFDTSRITVNLTPGAP